MKEYRCVKECTHDNALIQVGAVVFAEEKDMNGNWCFEPVYKEAKTTKPAKTETKAAETKTTKSTVVKPVINIPGVTK